jgi:non-specific serine/threonine protein kinase
MTDRPGSSLDAITAGASVSASGEAGAALPRGTHLGVFEVERVLARGAGTIVYLCTDHALGMPVAVQEYLPAGLVQRDAGLHLRPIAPWQEDAVARGLRAFIDESRLLARCDHPALVRVKQLFEANGSAYRVMPFYAGRRLSDLRCEMIGTPHETTLRRMLDGLLGALETIHRSGQAHGAVSPQNILLLADDRPLLLGPGLAGREINSDLVDSLMATLGGGVAARGDGPAALATARGVAQDLFALAETLRFCVTAEAPAAPGAPVPREPLARVVARGSAPGIRPPYSAALLGALDAALSPRPEERPRSAAQFRDWVERGLPDDRRPLAPPPAALPPAPAPAPVAEPMAEPTAALPPVPPVHEVAAPAAADAEPTGISVGEAAELPLPWPDEASPDALEAPITDHRAAWTPPPLPNLRRGASARERRNKVLMAVGLVALAVAVLAGVTGAWNVAPEIRMDPSAEEAAARLALPAAPDASIAPTDEAPQVTAPTAARAPDPRADSRSGAAATPLVRPAPQTPRSAVLPVAPEATEAAPTSPRAACGDRTEFALYRCMVTQCEAKHWAAHPQCIRLRTEDRID